MLHGLVVITPIIIYLVLIMKVQIVLDNDTESTERIIKYIHTRQFNGDLNRHKPSLSLLVCVYSNVLFFYLNCSRPFW